MSHLGGKLYGDGELVVSFQVDSLGAVSTATVLVDGTTYEIDKFDGQRPSVKLARLVANTVRYHLGREQVVR